MYIYPAYIYIHNLYKCHPETLEYGIHSSRSFLQESYRKKMKDIHHQKENLRLSLQGKIGTFFNKFREVLINWPSDSQLHRRQSNDKKYINKKERERHLPGYCQ